MQTLYAIIISLFFTFSVSAESNKTFGYGPAIKEYGKHAPVTLPHAFSTETQFKVAFDVSEAAKPGEVNRRFESLARFINMHVANGVKPENIHLALVVHGKAGFDLLNNEAYQQQFNATNSNIELLNRLAENQVSIHLCGQSAAYYGINSTTLNDNVIVELSAMTVHALLADQGYSINPF